MTKERNSKSSRWAGSAGRCGVFNKSRGFGAKLPRRILKAAGLPVRRPGGWGRSQAKPTVEVSTNFEGGLGPVDSGTKPGRSPSALHDLRHSFAVLRFRLWSEQSVDPGAKLPLLATYLEHVLLASSQRYRN